MVSCALEKVLRRRLLGPALHCRAAPPDRRMRLASCARAARRAGLAQLAVQAPIRHDAVLAARASGAVECDRRDDGAEDLARFLLAAQPRVQRITDHA